MPKYQGLLGVKRDQSFWDEIEEGQVNAEEHTGTAIQELDSDYEEETYSNAQPGEKRVALQQGGNPSTSNTESKFNIRENFHWVNGQLTPDSAALVPYRQTTLTDFWSTFTAGAETAINVASGNIPGAIRSGIETARGLSNIISNRSDSTTPGQSPVIRDTQAVVHRGDRSVSSSSGSEFSRQFSQHSAHSNQRYLEDHNTSVSSPRAADTPSQSMSTEPAPTAAEPMETAGGAPAAAPARAGTGPGAGAIGSAGMSTPTVYNPPPIHPGTPFQRDYIKSYRFILPACLSRLYKRPASDNGNSTDGELVNGLISFFLKVSSSCFIPMEYLFLYMDPREYHEIYNQFCTFHVEKIGAKVTTLGVRAPYTTGQSNIEVANANLQATLVDLTPLAHHYPVIHGGADRPDSEYQDIINTPEASITQLFNQIQGTVFAVDGSSTNITNTINKATFTNVSARFETRRWHPRAWIHMPEYTHNGIAAGSQSFLDGYHHSWPNYNLYVEKMVNGSNHLGLAFAKQYNVNETLWDRTFMGHRWPNNSAPQNNTDVQYVDQQFIGGNPEAQEATKVAKVDYAANSNVNSAIHIANHTEDHPQTGIPDYQLANVFSLTSVHNGDSTDKHFPFIFAMYNVRNITTDVATDISTGSPANDIVDLNLEFILDVALSATGMAEIPIYWNPTIRPTPQWQKKRRIWTQSGNGRSALQVYTRFKMLKPRYNIPIRQIMGNRTRIQTETT